MYSRVIYVHYLPPQLVVHQTRSYKADRYTSSYSGCPQAATLDVLPRIMSFEVGDELIISPRGHPSVVEPRTSQLLERGREPEVTTSVLTRAVVSSRVTGDNQANRL